MLVESIYIYIIYYINTENQRFYIYYILSQASTTQINTFYSEIQLNKLFHGGPIISSYLNIYICIYISCVSYVS